MNHKVSVVVLIFGVVLLATMLVTPGIFRKSQTERQTLSDVQTSSASQLSADTHSTTFQTGSSTASLAWPIANANGRVTKKFFGTKVSPGNSPVSPERFTGYHTGIDFETSPDEADTDMPVYAACDGPLVYRKYATGYGWVAVQACKLDNKAITVVYGHLRFENISRAVGTQLTKGQQIGMLGKGYSKETDGERKHLHFAIHGGRKINLLGYVKNRKSLVEWIDPMPLLGLQQ